MKRYDAVEFNCGGCGELLEAHDYRTGQLATCPSCGTTARIRLEDDGVPVKMGLKNFGNFETTVSREDAGRMGHTFLGGLLVALGVMLCAMFGISWPKQS